MSDPIQDYVDEHGVDRETAKVRTFTQRYSIGRLDVSQEDKRAVSKSPESGAPYPGDDFYQALAQSLKISRADAKEQWLKFMYSGARSGVSPLMKVAEFHDKFGLPGAEQEAPRELTDEEALFRVNFMLEELAEYAECSGFVSLSATLEGLCVIIKSRGTGEHDQLCYRAGVEERDFHGQLDALVDLSYVLHGTALFHGFNRFDQAFDTVHAANMAKVRATSEEQSKRGTKLDVVKPPGWTAPVLTEFLK